MLYLDWDETKAAINLEWHGISFEAASGVFDDPFHLTDENLEFEGEQRSEAIGATAAGLILHVTYVDEIDRIDIITRIISARKATPRERRMYEQNHKKGTRNTT